MGVAFPESRAPSTGPTRRERLLEQEAEMRRADRGGGRRAAASSPPGGAVAEDYVFQGEGPDGAATDVRLVELFAPGRDTLVIYSMMFPRAPDEDLPCPSCTQFLDSFDGVVEHASQRSNVAIVGQGRAAAPARPRRRPRLAASCACSRARGNAYNHDYHGETPDGSQQLPMLNVFRRDGDASATSGARSSSTSRPIPARTRATRRPSIRCGTSSTSPRRVAGPDWYPSLSSTASAAPCAAPRRAG
jgi:predicted dithiol-disulfide oxidoreductase (DUF899 family)